MNELPLERRLAAVAPMAFAPMSFAASAAYVGWAYVRGVSNVEALSRASRGVGNKVAARGDGAEHFTPVVQQGNHGGGAFAGDRNGERQLPRC